MPPKKKVVKKKKVEVKAPPFPIPRDLSDSVPIDAHDGMLGITHYDVAARIKSVHQELVLWKISEAVRSGDLDLDLSDRGLDTLPEEIFDLPWLQVLELSKNRFVNSIFDELKALSSLRAIDLSTNMLNGPLSDALGSLPASMEELCLDENVITSLSDAMAVLRELTWFSARRNLLTEIPPVCLASWTKLTHLDLRNNKIKVLPDEVAACVDLESLYLSGNELTALPETIGHLARLQFLYVQRNALTSLPESLEHCTEMVEFDASFNKLTVMPAGLCATALGLKKLILASNKITAIPPEIGHCECLEVLALAGNSISSLPEEIGGLTKLREICLNANPISTIPASVAGWGALEEASFKGCKLKALPSEISTSWSKVSVLDVRAKKKDTCKIAPEFKDSPMMRKVHMLGVVVTKAKKKKAAAKKK